jgi:hypothetical protein
MLVAVCATVVAADAPAGPSLINPILIGSEVPAVGMKNQQGEIVNLAEVVKNKSTVLVFYRGGW